MPGALCGHTLYVDLIPRIMADRPQLHRYESLVAVPSVEPTSHRTAACPCGCGRELGIFNGRVNFEDGFSFPFIAGTLRCSSGSSNMWVMVRLEPLPDDGQRDCWVAMHLWDDGETSARPRSATRGKPVSPIAPHGVGPITVGQYSIAHLRQCV